MENNKSAHSLGEKFRQEHEECVAKQMGKLVSKLLKKAAKERKRGGQSASITIATGISSTKLTGEVFEKARGYLATEDLNPTLKKYIAPLKSGESTDHYELGIDWSTESE